MITGVVLTSLVALYLVGCSTNRFFVDSWYNGLDDNMVERYSDYADFDQRQEDWIADAAAGFHAWHRRNQLPLYSGLLLTIRRDINSGETLGKERVEGWARQVDDLIGAATACHPLNRSTDFLAGLTDRQVAQIGDRIREKRRETREEDPQERFDEIVKWGGRIGLKFDDEQKAVLQVALARVVDLHQERHDLLTAWVEKFLSGLERRDAAGFGPSMQHHIGRLWRLSEDAYPEEWQYNRALWIDSIHQIFLLQSGAQRAEFSGWLDKMAVILASLSAKTDTTASLDTRNAPGCGIS